MLNWIMNTYYQTPAIVLATRDEREADRVVTFYTRDFGKIKAFARGIRLMKSKLRGHIVSGALIRIAFVEGKESYHLVDAEMLYNPLNPPYSKGEVKINSPLEVSSGERSEGGLNVRGTFNRGVTNMRALQFLDRVTGEQERDQELWQFLMHWLLEGKEINFLDFQVRALSLLGFLSRGRIASQKEINAALVANHLA